eukprot:9489433-Pyramimonas_sp.AAC.1
MRTIQSRRANAPTRSKFPNGVAYTLPVNDGMLAVNEAMPLAKTVAHQGLAQGRQWKIHFRCVYSYVYLMMLYQLYQRLQ